MVEQFIQWLKTQPEYVPLDGDFEAFWSNLTDFDLIQLSADGHFHFTRINDEIHIQNLVVIKKTKQLNWGNPLGFRSIVEQSIVDLPEKYTIEKKGHKFSVQVNGSSWFEDLGSFDTIEEARESAQKHFNSVFSEFIE